MKYPLILPDVLRSPREIAPAATSPVNVLVGESLASFGDQEPPHVSVGGGRLDHHNY